MSLKSYISVDLAPDDPLFEEYPLREYMVRATIYLDPTKRTKPHQFTVLSEGYRYNNPFDEGTDPFLIESWDLFIDQLGQELWTSPDQPPKRINATDPLKLLDLLLDQYPGEVTPSQIQECLGKYDYNGAAIRQLYQRLRSLIGRDMILASSRGLNPEKVIIIKEKPPWKPNTITK